MADQQNFPMCTAAASSTEDDCNADEMVSAGLVDNHAYSLIGAKEITTESGKPIRLCLLRNPWGKKEWTGAWSDNSAQWTEHIKAQVPNFLAKNDGCFWIQFEDYVDFFYITTICFFKTGYKESQVVDEQSKGQFGVAKITLLEDTVQPVAFSLDQINGRFKENGTLDHQYAEVRLFVVKVV